MKSTRGARVRLDTLTALRALAAFAVFGRHASDFLFNDPNSHFTRQGAAGVSFFFVLSGFVLTWSARPGDGAGHFYRRRLARIYPAYILVLFVTQGATFLKDGVSVVAVAANALLLQSWFPTAKVYFASDMGAWSLGCEMFFYLLFPLVLPRLGRLAARRRWQLAGLAACAELAVALATHSGEQASGVALWLVYILPITRFGEFLIGMVLAMAVRDGLRPRVTLGQASLLALAAYVAAGFVPVYLMWVAVTLVPFCLLITTAAVSDIEQRPTWLRSTTMVRLGEWSFAFYLVHISVVTVFAHLIGAHPGLGAEIAATLGALVVAVAGAGVVHTVIEVPMERRLRGESRKPAGTDGNYGNPGGGEGTRPVGAEVTSRPFPTDLDLHANRTRRGGNRLLRRLIEPNRPDGASVIPDPGPAPSPHPDRGAGDPGGGRLRGGGDDVGSAAAAGDAVGVAEPGLVHRDVLHGLRRAAAHRPGRSPLSGRLHPRRPWSPTQRGAGGGDARGEWPGPNAGIATGGDRVEGRGTGGGDRRVPPAEDGLHACDIAAERSSNPVEGAEQLDPGPVLVVMHYFPPHLGGMEGVGRSQAQSLSRRHRDVTVLTCAHRRGLLREEPVGGYTVRRIRAVNWLERRFGITFPLIGPVGALRILAAVRRAAIVHVHDVFYPTSHAVYLSARLLRRPYYLTQHVATVPHPNGLVMGVQRAIYSTVGGAMLRHAAGITVYNARVRDFVIDLGAPPERVGLSYNGIDVELFRPLADPQAKRELRRSLGLPEDRPVALFVGRLVPKKGFDIVAAAGTERWTTLIVGDGSGVELPGGEGVVYYGAADPDVVPDLYRASDVFVFPAVGEMLTLAMQEAMASGLPVVTTDDPAYGEYDLDRELIGFVARDASEVRRRIDLILSRPDLAARMASYSRRLAEERFSWEANYVHEYARYHRATPAGPVGAVAAAGRRGARDSRDPGAGAGAGPANGAAVAGAAALITATTGP